MSLQKALPIIFGTSVLFIGQHLIRSKKKKREELLERKRQREAKEIKSTFSHNLNPHIQDLSVDFYYHLGLDSSMNLKKMFGDVRFVLLSGSAVRAKDMIEGARVALGLDLPCGTSLTTVGKTERYSLYKCGPVLSCSHGMGKPSVSILLHELTKLLSASDVRDPLFVRVGTSGGVGVNPGTVIISTGTVNGLLESTFPLIVLGKVVHRPTHVDLELAQSIFDNRGDYPAVLGKTMATDDFYEGQGRIDGAICEHTLSQKMEFLSNAHKAGVRNIEMESDCVVAFCNKVGIRVGVVCAAILNRLDGDQVTSTPQQLGQYSANALGIVLRYIQTQLGMKPTA